jgi:hypothetical protein
MKHGTTACGKALCVGDDLLFPQALGQSSAQPDHQHGIGLSPQGRPPPLPQSRAFWWDYSLLLFEERVIAECDRVRGSTPLITTAKRSPPCLN